MVENVMHSSHSKNEKRDSIFDANVKNQVDFYGIFTDLTFSKITRTYLIDT